ncbi:MAG: deoxyribonuclease IV [candidate division NC10 bacterium]|nr:deoxyribonuclease IV [candidate division NC10 bacterium]
MPLGAHMSIAGGLDQALVRGMKLGCQTIQLFTKNRNRWQAKPLTRAEVEHFRRAQRESKIRPLLAHTSYLINLASTEPKIYGRSLSALKEEMERTRFLRIPYLVLHPGSHGGSGEREGLRRIARSLDRILREMEGPLPMILLETTAGQGSSLGWRFEHLAEIRDRSRFPDRLGFCFDTCHVFAAGYDLGSPSNYESTLSRFLGLIGIQQLKAFHLNDSQKGLGSRVDRHQHIGRGALGKLPFYLLLKDDRFSHLPMILETPKGREGSQDLDEINLKVLRDLSRRQTPPQQRRDRGERD